MKRRMVLFAMVALLSIGAPQEVMATCTDVTGPTCWAGICYYDYSNSPSCYTTYNTSGVTSSCGYGAWSFGDSSSANFSIPVGTFYHDNTWKVAARVYFNDPNNSSANWVTFGVTVRHSNNTTTSYPILTWSGTDGDITGCVISSVDFTATTGDTIEVGIAAAAGSGTPTITVEYPSITNHN